MPTLAASAATSFSKALTLARSSLSAAMLRIAALSFAGSSVPWKGSVSSAFAALAAYSRARAPSAAALAASASATKDRARVR